MKKVICLLLVLLISLPCISCNLFDSDFVGGEEGFSSYGDYYEHLLNTLYSSIGVSKGEYGKNISLSLAFSDYICGEIVQENNNGSFHFLLESNAKDAFAYTKTVDAFGFKYKTEYKFNGYESYADFGDLISKPYYYKSEQEQIVKMIIDSLKNSIKTAQFNDGEEIYKFNGESYKADTVEFAMNFNQLVDLNVAINEMFNVNPNNLLVEFYYSLKDIEYFVSDEKIHISWKRYFCDGIMTRELIKLYDNYGHYISIGTAVKRNANGGACVDLTVEAYDGAQKFKIFGLSAERTVKKDNSFNTKLEAIVGDEIYIKLNNSGDSSNSSGSGEVRIISAGGEIKLPVEYYVDNGAEVNFKCDTPLIEFNAVLELDCYKEAQSIEITKPQDYYRLDVLEDMSYYQYDYLSKVNSYKENVLLCLRGKEPNEIVDPFELDIVYDDGFTFQTEGSYGKEYIDILMSDSFTYIFDFPGEDAEHLMGTCYNYKSGTQELYSYLYGNGDTYKILQARPSTYEILHGVEKIIMREYTEDEFDFYYPKQLYYFNNSGKCVYNNRELVYENYTDGSGNRYCFIFDESGKPEITVITDSATTSTLYTFVKEISRGVPENAFELPPYEYISADDYYDN